jgi:hypothetical protein
VIERLLPRRDLGDSLIDRILSPLHRSSAGGRALKKVPLAMQTFARLFVARTAQLLLLFSKPHLLLLFSEAALLRLRSIVDGLSTHRAFVAVWPFFTRRRTPGGIGLPSRRHVIGRRIQPIGIREAAVAIMPRRSVRASEIPVPVARTPFCLVARFPLARAFVAIAMPLIRRVASRNKLRPRFFGVTVAQPMPAIAMMRARVALAIPHVPLPLVGFAVAMPRQPIAILFEHAVVVLRTLAAQFVRPIFAPASRRLRLAACIAFAKFFPAPGHGTIGRPVFGIGWPPGLVILRFCRLNDSVEPLAHGHAGPACGVPRSGARFRTETS